MKFGIPVVFYGENQAESGNAKEENLTPIMDTAFFTQAGGGDVQLGGMTISELLAESDFNLDDFSPYIPPSTEALADSSVEVRYLGYYLRWDPQECFYYAAENTGFRPSTTRTEGSYSKYSSLDDKIDPFHYWTTLIKFGLGRASYDAAQEIRNEKINRSEGVALVKKYDEEFPIKYFQEFLDYIDISAEEFHQTIERFRNLNLWTKTDGEWRLKKPVWTDEA